VAWFLAVMEACCCSTERAKLIGGLRPINDGSGHRHRCIAGST